MDEHADIDGEEMRKVAKESRTKYVFGIFDKLHELAYQAKSQPEPNEDVIGEIANAIGLAEKRFHWSGAHDVI